MPPVSLHCLASPWPFSTWGIDIIGKIHPRASNGHEYILVAVDYFTKWVEAASKVIFDNGSHFQDAMAKLFWEHNIKHHKSSPY